MLLEQLLTTQKSKLITISYIFKKILFCLLSSKSTSSFPHGALCVKAMMSAFILLPTGVAPRDVGDSFLVDISDLSAVPSLASRQVGIPDAFGKPQAVTRTHKGQVILSICTSCRIRAEVLFTFPGYLKELGLHQV